MRLRDLGALLASLMAACATATTAGSPARRAQASEMPAPNTLESAEERARLSDALVHARLGDAARDAGDVDRARAEWKAAGTALAALGKPAEAPNRLPYLASAARQLLQGGDPEGAAQAAGLLLADPAADAASRAAGARLRAAALAQVAGAEVKAGRLEPLSTAGAGQKAREIRPRPPPGTWAKLLEADDAYLANRAADAEPGAEENAAGAAYQAALIQYTFDNLDDAARRFLEVVTAFPGARYQSESATLHLQTFLLRGDYAGHAAALDRLIATVSQQSKAGGEKARAEQLARLEAQLVRERQGLGFQSASRLLAEGKARESAAAYEKFAADFPEHPDAPTGLYNAAIAWSQVKEGKKAMAAREKVLARYPDARVAPKALLAIAGDLSTAGDHAGAAKRYVQYLERYPTGDDRCLALLDAGAELDIGKKPAEAARHYLAHGTDPKCSKEDPNGAARLLYRAAAIFNKAGNRPDTQVALKALAGLEGVTDAQARSFVEDAQKRLK